MKLVSVDRALKELQNDTLFITVPYIVVSTYTNASSTATSTLRLCEVSFTGYGACTKELAGKGGINL